MKSESQQHVIDRLRDTLRQIAEFAEALPITATVELAREVYEDTASDASVRRLRRGDWHPVDLLDARHDMPPEMCRCYTSCGHIQYFDCPVHYSPPLPGLHSGDASNG